MLTEEHRAQRRRGIGGSDVAAIAGLSPWRTPLDVYLSKVEDVEQTETDAMRWGSILEAPIAAGYAQATGHRIRCVNRVLAHPEHPFILASLDRQIVAHPAGPGVLEVKTALRRSDEWGESGTGEIPDHYALQVHQYLLVTGWKWAELVVLFLSERRLATYHIEADSEIQAWLIALERHFWTDHVEPRIPPEPRSLSDLAKRYPKGTGSQVIAEPDVIEAVEDLRQVKMRIKELTDQQDALEIKVKLALGEASELVGADGKPLATWRTQSRKALDTKGIQAAHPELAAQFTKIADSRVFRLK